MVNTLDCGCNDSLEISIGKIKSNELRLFKSTSLCGHLIYCSNGSGAMPAHSKDPRTIFKYINYCLSGPRGYIMHFSNSSLQTKQILKG